MKRIVMCGGIIAALILAVNAGVGRGGEGDDIVATAAKAKKFKTLLKAAEAAGLVDVLKSKGPFTVFAPTDKAFSKIGEEKLKKIVANKKLLKTILLYHVVPGKVMAAQAMKLKSAETANKLKLRIKVKNGKVKINNATVIAPDVTASNGVIHVIDRVLVPKMKKKKKKDS